MLRRKPGIFIFGVPRSGTTALQSLLCATLGAEMMPEATYLTQLVELYWRNVTFPDDSRFPYFFGSRGEALRVYRKMVAPLLSGMRNSQPNHGPLVLKDPGMSLFLTEAKELMPQQFRWLGLVRHPVATVNSMKRVRVRQGSSWDFPAECHALYRHYDAIRQHARSDTSAVLRFEDLVNRRPNAVSTLESTIGRNVTWALASNPDWLKLPTAFSSPGRGRALDASLPQSDLVLTDFEIATLQDRFAGVMEHWAYKRISTLDGLVEAA